MDMNIQHTSISSSARYGAIPGAGDSPVNTGEEAKPSFFGRSLHFVQTAAQDGVPMDRVTMAVERSITRTDDLGELFDRAFRSVPPPPPPDFSTLE